VRLLRHLRRELDRRRALPAEQREAEPRIVVLIDGIGGFLAEHGDLGGSDTADAFRRIFSEGPGVGILFVVAGERPGVLPPRLGSLVGQRLLLRLADPVEFSAVGLRPRQLPAFVPGRALHAPSRLVVQVGHPGGNLAAAAEEVRARWPAPARPPTPIATLPTTLRFAELPGGVRLDGDPIELVLGLRDEDLGPAVLPLHAADHALITGPPRSGKSAALRLVAELVRRADPKAVLVGVCDQRSPLYDLDALDAAGPLDDLTSVLRLADRNPDRLWIVLVDDCPLVEDAEGVLTAALRSARPGFHVIGAGRGGDLRTAYGHWSRALRQSRNGLLLQPDLTGDGNLLGVRLPRRLPVPLLPGRGFLVSAGEAGLVQIALAPE
jgi:DNA segregation ATPase FtsK/SpoIIIE, S-DNA-T family